MRVARWSTTAAAIVFLAWGGAPARGAPDVVVLRSGTMMEGRVVSLGDEGLVLEIESGRSILDRDDIRSIHFDTTIGELRAPTRAPDDAAEEGGAPEEEEGPDRVFAPGDKDEFAVGDAVRVGALELRLTGVEVGRVGLIDFLGGEKESREDVLMVRFRAGNVGSLRELEVEGDPVFGEPLVRAEDERGRRIGAERFGPGERVEGALRHGDVIRAGAREDHVEVFEVPREGTERVVVRVDLRRFGGKGVVRWRVERGEW